jgi:CelD/BcsL family acetyltransferase involved in cellulose biosynthesis
VDYMEIKLISDIADLIPYIASWEQLASAALEPNPFYEPWMLLPAIRNLAAGRELRFVLVFDNTSPGEPILCGFFPLERNRRYMDLPIAAWAMWKHRHCFLTTPLIRKESAKECLTVFFDWLGSTSADCRLFELRHIPGEGRFCQLLIDQFTRMATVPLLWECFTRAFFQPRVDADAYLALSVTTKQRSELRRRGRLLSESGRLEYAVLDSEPAIEQWSNSFLELEAAGWKGREMSALASQPADRTFFREIVTEAFKKGRLLMSAITIDGTPIAQHCFFLGGGGAFYFKTGFDEKYAKLAPGFYLECETIRYLHARQDIQWMDTCTSADNELYNRLFLDRRTIQTLLVPMGKGLPGLAISTLPLLRSVKRSVHSMVSPAQSAGGKSHAAEVAHVNQH